MVSAAAGQATSKDETGTIEVFSVAADGALRLVASTPSAPHARTGLFVPTRRALYVAVPMRGGRDPEIREYKVTD
jgi:hypothetical protein